MTYNTGNILGSNDVRDLSDNATIVENDGNGPAAAYLDSYNTSKSISGTKGQFDSDQPQRAGDFCELLESSGYETPIDYLAGLSITRPTQTIRYEGELYRAKDASLPFTATAWVDDAASFFAIGDAVLRQELSSPDGASMVGFVHADTDSVIRTAQDKMCDRVCVKDFGAVGDGVTDDSDAIQAAFLSTNKPVYIPTGSFRITRTLYRAEGLIIGEGFQSKLMFEGLAGTDGIVFAPVSYQTTSGAVSLAIYAKGSNGGRAFSTPYSANQYNSLYSNWHWENLLIAGAASPPPGTNNAFETVETWLCGIEQGDGFSCRISNIYFRGNYRSDTDPATQAQSCFLRLNAARTLLTAYAGDFTATNVYRGVEIGDRVFFQILRFDIAHVYDGIYQIASPANTYGESKLLHGNINAQHYGVYFNGASSREISGVVIRRHRTGWKGATYDWSGIELNACHYVWITDCQVQPDASNGLFAGNATGINTTDSAACSIKGFIAGGNLTFGISMDNCVMMQCLSTFSFQNASTQTLFRLLNNTRTSSLGEYKLVSSFNGTVYADDGSIGTSVQFFGRDVQPVGSAPAYTWRRSTSAANEKIWRAVSGATNWAIQMATDDEVTNANALVLTRSGTTLTQADLRTTKLVLANGPSVNVGHSSPEGTVVASVGSLYMRTAGGASTSFYVKEFGSGNTGWVAK